MNNLVKLSIVVPCFNEAKNIPLIFQRFDKIIDRDDIEVILVNNGSDDDSEDIIQELLPKYRFAKSLRIMVNEGYGNGISSGLRMAKGEFVGYTHADMQTDPADIIKALKILENSLNPSLCFVKGDRKGRPFFDRFFTIGMSFFESFYLRTWLWDINAQPNIFPAVFFDKIYNDCPKDFSLDLFILYKAKMFGMNIVRFPVLFPSRIHGNSSWNNGIASKWKFIKRTLDFSVKLKRNFQ